MPTKYYTFDTEQEAQAYNEQVTNLENYDTTLEWCKPMKGQKWAVIASDLVKIKGKNQVELSSDWFD